MLLFMLSTKLLEICYKREYHRKEQEKNCKCPKILHKTFRKGLMLQLSILIPNLESDRFSPMQYA